MRATNLIAPAPASRRPRPAASVRGGTASRPTSHRGGGPVGIRINLVPRDAERVPRNLLHDLYERRVAVEQHRRQPAIAGTERAAQDAEALGRQTQRRRAEPRDKSWFQTTTEQRQRHSGDRQLYDADSSPYAYRPDPSRPAVNETSAVSFAQRLTWQATMKTRSRATTSARLGDAVLPLAAPRPRPATEIDAARSTRPTTTRSGRGGAGPMPPDAVRDVASLERTRHRQELPRREPAWSAKDAEDPGVPSSPGPTAPPADAGHPRPGHRSAGRWGAERQRLQRVEALGVAWRGDVCHRLRPAQGRILGAAGSDHRPANSSATWSNYFNGTRCKWWRRR